MVKLFKKYYVKIKKDRWLKLMKKTNKILQGDRICKINTLNDSIAFPRYIHIR